MLWDVDVSRQGCWQSLTRMLLVILSTTDCFVEARDTIYLHMNLAVLTPSPHLCPIDPCKQQIISKSLFFPSPITVYSDETMSARKKICQKRKASQGLNLTRFERMTLWRSQSMTNTSLESHALPLRHRSWCLMKCLSTVAHISFRFSRIVDGMRSLWVMR